MKADDWNHAPENYDCPFCRFAGGSYDSLNATTDLVATTMHAVARVSPKWWPNNRGHVIVAPVAHFENLYALPSDVFPRYLNDQLYTRHDEAANVSTEERAPYGALLRAHLRLQ
ncbi:Histidine triad (HIT) protein [Rhodococcus sp. RD6.2]|nr:Histidine triad (HIT) protein [Rhodococcus sp. RD6.2]